MQSSMKTVVQLALGIIHWSQLCRILDILMEMPFFVMQPGRTNRSIDATSWNCVSIQGDNNHHFRQLSCIADISTGIFTVLGWGFSAYSCNHLGILFFIYRNFISTQIAQYFLLGSDDKHLLSSRPLAEHDFACPDSSQPFLQPNVKTHYLA